MVASASALLRTVIGALSVDLALSSRSTNLLSEVSRFLALDTE
jgi:hypothetical protein